MLPDTALQYANSSGVQVDNQGQWRPGGTATLLAPAALTTWAVINLASQRCSNRAVATFASQLREEMQRQGMQVQQPFAIRDSSSSTGSVGAAFDALMQEATGRKTPLQLVLVVLPEKGSSLYKQVKQEALQRGLVTQCVVAPQEDASSKNMPYLNMVLLKINAKLVNRTYEPTSSLILLSQLPLAGRHCLLQALELGHDHDGWRDSFTTQQSVTSPDQCNVAVQPVAP